MTQKTIESIAYNMLIKHAVTNLPIESMVIATEYFRICTYEAIIDNIGGSHETFISTFGNALLYYQNGYFLAYNDKCSHIAINWAIAHELGHAIIRTALQLPVLSYPSRTFEMEATANAYAYSFLCPDVILYALKIKSWIDIYYLCHVPSREAHLKELLHKSYSDLMLTEQKKQILSQFETFIQIYPKR